MVETSALTRNRADNLFYTETLALDVRPEQDFHFAGYCGQCMGAGLTNNHDSMVASLIVIINQFQQLRKHLGVRNDC